MKNGVTWKTRFFCLLSRSCPKSLVKYTAMERGLWFTMFCNLNKWAWQIPGWRRILSHSTTGVKGSQTTRQLNTMGLKLTLLNNSVLLEWTVKKNVAAVLWVILNDPDQQLYRLYTLFNGDGHDNPKNGNCFILHYITIRLGLAPMISASCVIPCYAHLISIRFIIIIIIIVIIIIIIILIIIRIIIPTKITSWPSLNWWQRCWKLVSVSLRPGHIEALGALGHFQWKIFDPKSFQLTVSSISQTVSGREKLPWKDWFDPKNRDGPFKTMDPKSPIPEAILPRELRRGVMGLLDMPPESTCLFGYDFWMTSAGKYIHII